LISGEDLSLSALLREWAGKGQYTKVAANSLDGQHLTSRLHPERGLFARGAQRRLGVSAFAQREPNERPGFW
jgi:hypothetical protein